VVVPVSVGQCVGGIENADSAAFVAVAAAVTAAGGAERRRGICEILDPLVQARLVILDLNEQRYVGFCRDLEMFFWQCSASSVTMVSLPTPSSASKLCAAGISLDFSAMSTWASRRAVSVANAHNI